MSSAEIQAMLARLVHRGPDSGGHWIDEQCGISMGHRRLAIVDLSDAGHQPMTSHTGRFVISLNGEIYNFGEIKNELARQNVLPELRGTSDTEVALAAIEAWGLEASLKAFNGMFAFALWDRQDKALYLARDRIGKKPLYYGHLGDGSFVFASELKAFQPLNTFDRQICPEATSLYLELGYIPAPYSIFKKIKKLMPGSFAVLSRHESTPAIQRYWNVIDAVGAGVLDRGQNAENMDYSQLEGLLEDAVKVRMVADVPIGALLSGGVDSSLVVALMQRVANRPVNTYSIGFEDSGFNEAQFANDVAKHLGTVHRELYISAADCLKVIPSIPEIYDEPFADSSQIPTYLVSKLAKTHVTVCLTGDGGDEFFGGYNRYNIGRQLLKLKQRMHPLIWQAAIASIGALSPHSWAALYGAAYRSAGRNPKIVQIEDKILKLSNLLKSRDSLELYLGLIGQWTSNHGLLKISGANDATARSIIEKSWRTSGLEDVERMMLVDSLSYLPDDILVKVDRANMAVALEGRAPLLDYRVIEHSWRISLKAKLGPLGTKSPLRSILYKMVPRELMERPKMGFSIPVASWLRGPLRDWAEALLDPTRLREQGLLDESMVSQTWREHLKGSRNWQAKLWTVLMLQAWIDEVDPNF
jgi:asparagine synthase (glutamine-hydrolysing)